ncbi:NAD(P)H-quinone oxidoreductase subunit J [Bienertia sinuspersici]
MKHPMRPLTSIFLVLLLVLATELQKLGLADLQVKGSKDYVLGKETVNLFAKLRDLLKEVVEVFAEDVFASSLAHNFL